MILCELYTHHPACRKWFRVYPCLQLSLLSHPTAPILVLNVSNDFSQMFGCRDSGGEFLPFLLVSKGKKLLARLLPFLKHDAALKVLRIVTSNLPTLMSRDAEEVGEVFCLPCVFFLFGLQPIKCVHVL